MASEVTPASPKKKAKSPCVWFPMGKCKKGDDCPFVHGSQGNDMTSSSTASSKGGKHNGVKDKSNKKSGPSTKEICKHWKSGKSGSCSRGRKCTFLHQQQEKGNSSEEQNPDTPDSEPLKTESDVDPSSVKPIDLELAVSGSEQLPEPDSEEVVEEDEQAPDAQNTWDNDWTESHNNEEEDKKSVASSPSVEPFSSNQSNAAYSQSSGNRPKSFSAIPPPPTQVQMSGSPPVSSASIPPLQANPYTPFTPLPPSSFGSQVAQVPAPHWSEYADPGADLNRPFCKFFTQGRCSQGQSCSARHSLAIMEYTTLFRESQPPLWSPNSQSLPHSSPTVPIFQPPVSTQSVMLAYPLQPPQAGPPQTTISPPCLFYPSGKCKNGSACPFAHIGPAPAANRSDQDLTSTQRDQPSSQQDTKPICKTYQQSGYCRNGDWCNYSHDIANNSDWPQPGPRRSDSEFLQRQCRQYASGNCRYGDRCRFVHDGPVENQQNKDEWGSGANEMNQEEKEGDNGWNTWVDGWSAEPAPQEEEPKKAEEESGWGADAWETYQEEGKRDENNAQETQENNSVAEEGWGENGSEHDSMDIPICEDFVKGLCQKGDDCDLRHEVLTRNLEDDPDAEQDLHGGRDKADKVDEASLADQDEKALVEDVKVALDEHAQEHRELDVNNQHGRGPESVAESHDASIADDIENLADSPPPIYDMPIIEKRMLNSVVQFGSGNGCIPTKVRTASESRRVMLYNLPPEIQYDELRGVVDEVAAVDYMDVQYSEGFATAAIDLLGSSQAQDITVQMDGRELFGRTLIARLDTTAPETVMDPLVRSSVLLSWPAPSRYAWVYYPTVTIAKAEEARIRGSNFMGRTLDSSFFRPRPKQTDSFAVKVTGLPFNADLKSIRDLCPKNTNVALGDPTYSNPPADDIRELLRLTAPIDSLSFLSLNDFTKTRHIAYARFTEGVERVVQLHGVSQPFLGQAPISVFQVHHAAYSLPKEKHAVIEHQLEELRQRVKQQDGCNVIATSGENGMDYVVHAHSKFEDPAIFHNINRELQLLIRGRVLLDGKRPVWDEYFNLPSSSKPIEKMNAEVTYLIQVDLRIQQIHVWGNEVAYEGARNDVAKLLKSVRARRHIIDLDISSIGKLVHGGYRSLQQAFGANKLSLNVVSQELIVRGDRDMLAQVRDQIGSPQGDSEDLKVTNGGGVACALCRRSPKPTVRLSCNHFYCRPCLRLVIQASNRPSFSPVQCIARIHGPDGSGGIQCSGAIPFVLIRDLLPEADLEQLLRYSFLRHVRSQEDEYFFCPVAGCETLYRPWGRRGTLYQCPICQTYVCSSCRLEYHEGISCEAKLAIEVDPASTA